MSRQSFEPGYAYNLSAIIRAYPHPPWEYPFVLFAMHANSLRYPPMEKHQTSIVDFYAVVPDYDKADYTKTHASLVRYKSVQYVYRHQGFEQYAIAD